MPDCLERCWSESGQDSDTTSTPQLHDVAQLCLQGTSGKQWRSLHDQHGQVCREMNYTPNQACCSRTKDAAITLQDRTAQDREPSELDWILTESM
jgi:hypothetical protein